MPEEPRRVTRAAFNAIQASLDQARLLEAEYGAALARWQLQHNQLLAENCIRPDGSEVIDEEFNIVPRPQAPGVGEAMARAHRYEEQDEKGAGAQGKENGVHGLRV